VFWDLYCAAPERREQCDHSSEAKAFHDYGFVSSGYGVNGIGHNSGPTQSPLGQLPPSEGIPGGPMGPNFFPNSTMRPSPPTHPTSQQSPHPQPPSSHNQMMTGQVQPFMGAPRYPSAPRPGGVRMQGIGNDFNGPPGQPMMPNSMDPSRQGGPPGIGMSPRMNAPRGPALGPMGPAGYGPASMRGPPPGAPGMPPGMGMASGGRPQWQPNTSTPMNYSSSSPGNYGGPPGSGPPGPGTPIMPSPQDSSNSGGDNMYTLMKPVNSGNMGADFPMSAGGDTGSMGPMGPNTMGPVINGNDLDGMKNSPANGGPGTPREDSGSGMGDYNLGGFGGPGENVDFDLFTSVTSNN